VFDLENASQWDNLLKESHIVIANFYSKGEHNSEKMINSLKEYTNELSQYPDTIFVRVEKNTYPEIFEKCAITETPALMVFHHEQPVKVLENSADPKGNKTTKIVGVQKDLPRYLRDLIANLHIPAKK
jgi:DUF438 domain-containing protein